MAPFVPHALIRGARLRPGAPPVDIRLREGRIAEIGEHLTTAGAEVHDAGGARAVADAAGIEPALRLGEASAD